MRLLGRRCSKADSDCLGQGYLPVVTSSAYDLCAIGLPRTAQAFQPRLREAAGFSQFSDVGPLCCAIDSLGPTIQLGKRL